MFQKVDSIVGKSVLNLKRLIGITLSYAKLNEFIAAKENLMAAQESTEHCVRKALCVVVDELLA